MKKLALAAFVAGIALCCPLKARAQQWTVPEISHTIQTSNSGTLVFNSTIDVLSQNCLQHITVVSSSGPAILNIKTQPQGNLLYSVPLSSSVIYDTQWSDHGALCGPAGASLTLSIVNGGGTNTSVISAEEFITAPNVITNSFYLRLEDFQVLLLEDGSHLLLN